MRIEQFYERSEALADPYSSRVDDQYETRARLDPVVYSDPLKDGMALTAEQKQAFERDGFLILDGAFTQDEVAGFNQELNRMARDSEFLSAAPTITEPLSGEVRSIFEIHKVSPVFEKLALDRRIAGAARDILNDDLYIHQSRLNYKPGFKGKEFFWHSDFETWHVEDGMPRMRAVSASILLTDNRYQNGPLMVIPGSHKTYLKCAGRTPDDNYKRSLKVQEVGVPDQENLRRMTEKGGLVAATREAGSLVLFDCNLMHGSAGNITPFPRSNTFFVFNAMSNQLMKPFGPEKARPEFLAEQRPKKISF